MLGAILGILSILAISFLFMGFIVWLASIIFGFAFHWVTVLFVWLVVALIRGIFSDNDK